MPTAPDDIRSLIANSWNVSSSGDIYGVGLSLSYSFVDPLNLPSHVNGQLVTDVFGKKSSLADVRALSAAQRNAFSRVLMSWEAVANINFTATANTGQISVGLMASWPGDAGAITPMIAGDLNALERYGDIWLGKSNDVSDSLIMESRSGFFVPLHEVGHAPRTPWTSIEFLVRKWQAGRHVPNLKHVHDD
jgi:hypothetical protein